MGRAASSSSHGQCGVPIPSSNSVSAVVSRLVSCSTSSMPGNSRERTSGEADDDGVGREVACKTLRLACI